MKLSRDPIPANTRPDYREPATAQDSPDKFAPSPATASSNPLEVGATMPKSMGRCADLYHDVRELRLLMQKECEAIEAREKEIQEHIINNLSRSEDTGASGLRYRAQVKTEAKPQIADWQALTSYIMENDRFDLLQKRLGEKAVADLWEAGTAIPGVAKVNVPKLSVTKI